MLLQTGNREPSPRCDSMSRYRSDQRDLRTRVTSLAVQSRPATRAAALACSSSSATVLVSSRDAETRLPHSSWSHRSACPSGGRPHARSTRVHALSIYGVLTLALVALLPALFPSVVDGVSLQTREGTALEAMHQTGAAATVHDRAHFAKTDEAAVHICPACSS